MYLPPTIQPELSDGDRQLLDTLFYNDIRLNQRDIGYQCPLMKGFSKSPEKSKRILIESCDCPSARKFLLKLELCGPQTVRCKVRDALPKRLGQSSV